jgi:hypothetical protein
MIIFRSSMLALVATIPCVLAFSLGTSRADDAQVTFDLPDTIECRDATPKDFQAAHPTLKVIEGKFRVSARFVAGSEGDIVDFLYVIASPDRRMRFQDYLPNTTLESTVADDRIEITDTTESVTATEGDAHVGYKVLNLGISRTKGAKKTESTHAKQIANRALVVSSGTTDREHGIFFKLRPSKLASLEGAKEFTFLATVPKTWRGDWCTISCDARARGKGFILKGGVVSAGVEQAQVGLYLAGDAEAVTLVQELRTVQEAHAAVLDRQLAKDGDGLLETMHAAVLTGYSTALCGMFKAKPPEQANIEAQKKSDPEHDQLEAAQKAVVEVQNRLRRLAE